MSRDLTGMPQTLLDGLPLRMRDDPLIQASFVCQGREIERIREAVEELRRDLILSTAGERGVEWVERLTPIRAPSGASLEQRRASLVATLGAIYSAGSQWEAAITATVGPGWSYREHIPGDPGAPEEYQMLIRLPYDVDSPSFRSARAFIESISAAHLQLIFQGGGFMHWDTGQWDVSAFES